MLRFNKKNVMKTTILLLFITSTVFGQVTSNEVYEKLGYPQKTDTTLTKQAYQFSAQILAELGLFNSFDMPSSDLGDLTAYTGTGEEVIKLIESDKDYYKGSSSIFVYSGYDFDTDWTVVLVYILKQ